MDIIKFFRHEPNARNDAKIVKLMMKRGVSGIGIFWCIVEMLYQSGGELMLSECERIAFELRTDSESIADVMLNYDLFDVKNEIITSRNVTEQIENILKNSKTASENAKKRWQQDAERKKDKPEKCDGNAGALQSQCKGNAKNKSKNKSNKNISPDADAPAPKSYFDFETEKAQAILKCKKPDEFKELVKKSGYKLSTIILILTKRLCDSEGRDYVATGKERKAAKELAEIMATRAPDIGSQAVLYGVMIGNAAATDIWRGKLEASTVLSYFNKVWETHKEA